MTDKQIIINGVDVSECNFTLERDGKIKCECCHATGFGVICDCEAWKTCHYKKYKRKEQAEKRLVGQMQTICDFINNRTDIFKGIYGSVDKIITEYAERKEQECEKIKNWVKGMMFYTDCSNWFERFTTAFEDWKNDLTSQLDQLKAENEELRKEIEAIYDDCKGCPTCNEALYNANLYAKEYRKLKQTLTEIKEIVELHAPRCNDNADCDFECEVCHLRDLKQILQKISEVEDDRN